MEQILAKLLEHGPFGLMSAYLMWKNWDLTKRLRSLEDSRHDEAQENIKSFEENRRTIDLFKIEIGGKLDQVKEAILGWRNK